MFQFESLPHVRDAAAKPLDIVVKVTNFMIRYLGPISLDQK